MEIKKEDLRLNNYLFYRDKEKLLTVSNLGNTFETIDERGLLYGSDDITEYKGVPITEDILLRLGFKRFCKDWAKKGIIIHTRKRGFVLKKSVPDIKYVHQLQNLFFALSGEELKIKEQ